MVSIIFSAQIFFWSLMLLRFDRDPYRLKHLVVDGELVPDSRIVQSSIWVNRRVGLLNHTGLAPGHGLLIGHCKQVHTIVMLFAIDVIYLDKHNLVCGIEENCEANKRTPKLKRASQILELKAFEAKRIGLNVGTHVTFVDML